MEYVVKTSKGDVYVNDGLDVFSSKHKEEIKHRDKKNGLGARLNILRHRLSLLFRDDWVDDSELEDLLDAVLVEHDYDLEAAIYCFS